MRVLVLSGIIIVCDQVSKLLVKGINLPWLGVSIPGMHYGTSRPIIGDFFRLTYIENPGMAFGIDVGGKLFFSVFSIIASVAILMYLYRARNDALGFRISLAMIFGGAVGNLIDRMFYGIFFDDGSLFYGKVVDFFDVDFFNIDIWGYHLSRWPVFNIADASVTVGVILLLFFHRKAIGVEDEVPVAGQAVPAVTSPDQEGTESQNPLPGSDPR